MSSRTVATRPQIKHGTPYAYSGWCCRCDACRLGWSAYHRDRKRYIREHGVLVPGWRDAMHASGGSDD